MTSKSILPVHTSNTFEYFNGVSTAESSNPYDTLLSASKNDPAEIQSRYTAHRVNRNKQQKEKMLDKNFTGISIDPILLRLSDPTIQPGYVDPRHCLVFWGRPTQEVKRLIQCVQEELLMVAPNLWLMPQDNLHITALEITHSKKAEEIQLLVDAMQKHIPAITDYTFEHRTRLIKPMIGFDASALALSFVPAAGEGLHGSSTMEDDKFTYHHLRRDLYNLCRSTGVQVDSRYVVPSSHLTLGRFISTKDFEDDAGLHDPAKIERLIQKIDELNQWLEANYWPDKRTGTIQDGGEFIVGQEKGLYCGKGTLWYGGAETVHQGKGF